MNPRGSAVLAFAVMITVVGAISAPIIFPRPMTVPVVDESNFEVSTRPPEQAKKVQQPPPVLIKVAISPEARVKATATAGQRDLRQGEWSEFSMVIDNAAGITAPLVVESEQLLTSEDDPARDRWLRLEMEPSGPLSGAATETRILRLLSRDPGIRTAVLNINAGQGTQDLGFRSDVILSFRMTRSKSALRNAVGGLVATPRRRRYRQSRSEANQSTVAASYARYSSDHQREASITDQRRKCQEAATANGHEIRPELEYADEAVSGTNLHRAGLDQLLCDAQAGEFQTLYFHSLSRLARESVITMPMLKRLVHKFRIRVISVTEGIDSSRDGWDVIASIMSLLHERFIKELGEYVFRGQEGAILAGYSAGDFCFGYRTEAVPGTEATRRGTHAKPRKVYVIYPDTAGVVHLSVVRPRGAVIELDHPGT